MQQNGTCSSCGGGSKGSGAKGSGAAGASGSSSPSSSSSASAAGPTSTSASGTSASSAGGPKGQGGTARGSGGGGTARVGDAPAAPAGAPVDLRQVGATSIETIGAGGGGGSGFGNGQSDGTGSAERAKPREAATRKPTGLFKEEPAPERDSSADLPDAPSALPDEPREPDSQATGDGASKRDTQATSRTTKENENPGRSSGGGAGGSDTERPTDASSTATGAAGGAGSRESPGADSPANGKPPEAGATPSDKSPEPAAQNRGAQTPSGGDGGDRSAGEPGLAEGDDPDRDAAGGQDGNHADQAASTRASRDARTDAEDLDLPELDLRGLESDESAIELSGTLERGEVNPVRGFWRQVDGPRDSDFAPGGYLDSMLMLNPSRKSCAVYRLFRGSLAIVLGGELALDVTVASDGRSGQLVVRRDPSLPSEFRDEPLSLGGMPATVVVPPEGAGPWTIPWRRDGANLVVGDKRYVPADRAAFDDMRRGGADEATPDERAERLPRPREDAAPVDRNETSFFGVRGGGKRICFIVDVSGSMAGLKLDRLKQELDATIQGLPDATLFSVVFFDHSTHVMDQGWMKGAPDKSRAAQMIAAQGTGGGTDPTGAFQFAFSNLSPLPDCIYFMTDGMIPAHIPGLVSQLNAGKRPTTVHAICFGERAGEPALQQLARDGGGTYLYVEP